MRDKRNSIECSLDLDALRSNIARLKQLAPDFMPMVKANFYYHGRGVIPVLNESFDRMCFDLVADADLMATSATKYVLGDFFDDCIEKYNARGIIPVLPPHYPHDGRGEFAYFIEGSNCRRRDRPDTEYTPTFTFAHSRQVTTTPQCVTSIGSTVDVIAGKRLVNPRVGLGLFGFSTDQKQTDLTPVKTVRAVITDVLPCNRYSHYGYAQDSKGQTVYVLAAGEKDNLVYHQVDLYCPESPTAKITMLPHLNMSHSYVVSSEPLLPGFYVELLGVHVTALDISKSANISIANALKIGNMYG